ncbi:hydrolase [Ameyamaea chiangmaiensis NBRC 103196]|uniref:NUDIX hydrolase n=1 Tax=Ameyamaea chiangmaiensis TaxID=442969 RepID=A0A850P3R4_9PROT|nr:NUDIX hydrolase [Ameyamaea chiangmaiensis]MBS4075832.1 NUDIX hydrolase [Ameyamaea chiangmaiensis]NVN39297.1 NUDIX hydrolase [Ameyamaea chiangmaiensis]GBQ63914.1 hydrolase [Ameyamaea chiangmaiensis NBRC 103196]
MNEHYPRAGVVAIVRRGDAFLLVRRGRAPNAGRWGFPGGKIEYGETLFHAAERELREETALDGRSTRVVTAFDVIDRAPDGTVGYHYLAAAVACEVDVGTPRPGDDAAEVRWFTPGDLRSDDDVLPRVLDVVALVLGLSPEAAEEDD